MARRHQIKRNVTILRLVLERIAKERGWFSARTVAAGIDHSVAGSFVSPSSKRLLAHLVEAGVLLHDEGRYYVPSDESRQLVLEVARSSNDSMSQTILETCAGAT